MGVIMDILGLSGFAGGTFSNRSLPQEADSNGKPTSYLPITAPVERLSPIDRSQPVNLRTESVSLQASQQQTLNLSLMTKDGDLVELEIFSGQVLTYQSDRVQQKTSTGLLDQQQTLLQARSRQSLDFRVVGELDTQEQEAIQRLMGQVGQLADQFFEQQPQQRLEQLNQLGLETGEIVSLSLEMSRTESYDYRQQVAQSYQEATSADSLQAELPSYVSGLANALELSDMFEDPFESLLQLMQLAVRQLGQIQSDQSVGDTLDQQLEQASRLNQELLSALVEQQQPLDDGADD